MTAWHTLFRWLWLVVAGIAAVLVLIVAVVVIIAPRIDIANVRPRIEAVAGQALGRDLELQGPLSLRLSLPPTIEAEQIYIGNPPGWSNPEFARVENISATISLIPLLRSQIVIDEIYTSGVNLSLEAAADGRTNWTFGEETPQASNGNWKFVAVDQLSLRDLYLKFSDQTQQLDFELRIEDLSAKLPADEPIWFNMAATALDIPFSIDATGGSLTEILTSDGTVPIEAVLGFDSSQLQLTGSVTSPLAPKEIDVAFRMEGNTVDDIAAILGTPLPNIGEYQIRGDISGNLDLLTISDAEANFGPTSISGDLQLGRDDQGTRITGSLVAGTLDLAPWLVPKEAPTHGQPAEESGPTSTVFSEVDLQLEMVQFINLPVDVKDASVALTLRNNVLTALLQAAVDGVTVQGEIAVERENGEDVVTARLRAQQVDVGDLLQRHTELKGIEGKVDELWIVAGSQGTEMQSLLENLSVSMGSQNAAMAYGNDAGEAPVAVDIDEMLFDSPGGQRTSLSVDGRLLGEPFSVQLELGDLKTILENANLPFKLQATGAGAELVLSGQFSGEGSTDDSTLQVRLTGKRFGELAPWLGVSPEAEAPFSLSGDLSIKSDRNAWRLHDFHAQLGRSSIEGTIGRSGLNSQPLLQTSLAFDVIDPFELERFFVDDEGYGNKKNNGGVSMDLPILPKGLNFDDMDIDIKGERVVMESSDITDITDIFFSTRIRDGHVASAPFQGTLADTTFMGSLALDLRGDTPEIRLGVESDNVNIGNILRELQLANEIEASSKRLNAQVVARGSSISDLVDDAEINVETHSGTWLLADPNQAGTLRIEVPHGTAKTTTRDKHTMVTLDALIDGVPMEFTLETKRLPKRPGVDQLLDTKIKAITAGAELTMQGLVPRLGGLHGLDMHISLHGSRIDGLNEFFDVSLPPFGPYSVDGRLQIGDTEYQIADIAVRVGETVANGHLKLSTAGARPHINGMLEAKTFQLDDFRLGDWSPLATTDKENENSNSLTEHNKVGRAQAESAQPLLSRDVMRAFEGMVDIRVGAVLSGQDRLGFGEMNIELRNGRVSLWLDLDLPGGEAALELSLEANEEDYTAALRSQIENFDYGVFARRIKPDTDMAGKFSLDVDLASHGKTFKLMDDNAAGYFDFAIWPETLRSGIFDLWTANLFFAVLPVLNLQTKSRVNCIVGRFPINNGVMIPDPLFMDTTRTQVRAKGEINFRTKRVNLRLSPRSKRPKFFSLATPIVVEGSFADFGVGLRPDDLFGTVIRMVATVILVPARYIAHGVRPDFDRRKCEQAMGVRDE